MAEFEWKKIGKAIGRGIWKTTVNVQFIIVMSSGINYSWLSRQKVGLNSTAEMWWEQELRLETETHLLIIRVFSHRLVRCTEQSKIYTSIDKIKLYRWKLFPQQLAIKSWLFDNWAINFMPKIVDCVKKKLVLPSPCQILKQRDIFFKASAYCSNTGELENIYLFLRTFEIREWNSWV